MTKIGTQTIEDEENEHLSKPPNATYKKLLAGRSSIVPIVSHVMPEEITVTRENIKQVNQYIQQDPSKAKNIKLKADFQALKSKKTAGFTVLKQEKQTKKNDTSSNKSKLNEPHKSLNALRTSCIDTFPQMERNSSQLALMNATNGSLPNVNVRTSKRTSDIDKSKVNRVKSDMYQKYPSTKCKFFDFW